MTTLTDLYRQHVPGYAKTVDQLDTLAKTPPVLATAEKPEDVARNHILDRLSTGAPIDDGLADAMVRAANEVTAAKIYKSAADWAKSSLEQRRDTLVQQHCDTVLGALDLELRGVVESVCDIPGRDQLASIETAVRAGRLEDHQALRDLLRDHGRVRSDQLRLMRLVTDTRVRDIPLPEPLFAKNIHAVFDLWAPWRSHGYLVHWRSPRTQTIRPPWPVPGDAGINFAASIEDSVSRSTFTDDATSPDFLLWAIDQGAELWVPTRAQLREETVHLNDVLTRDRPGIDVENGTWLDPGERVDTGAPAHLRDNAGTPAVVMGTASGVVR